MGGHLSGHAATLLWWRSGHICLDYVAAGCRLPSPREYQVQVQPGMPRFKGVASFLVVCVSACSTYSSGCFCSSWAGDWGLGHGFYCTQTERTLLHLITRNYPSQIAMTPNWYVHHDTKKPKRMLSEDPQTFYTHKSLHRHHQWTHPQNSSGALNYLRHFHTKLSMAFPPMLQGLSQLHGTKTIRGR